MASTQLEILLIDADPATTAAVDRGAETNSRPAMPSVRPWESPAAPRPIPPSGSPSQPRSDDAPRREDYRNLQLAIHALTRVFPRTGAALGSGLDLLGRVPRRGGRDPGQRGGGTPGADRKAAEDRKRIDTELRKLIGDPEQLPPQMRKQLEHQITQKFGLARAGAGVGRFAAGRGATAAGTAASGGAAGTAASGGAAGTAAAGGAAGTAAAGGAAGTAAAGGAAGTAVSAAAKLGPVGIAIGVLAISVGAMVVATKLASDALSGLADSLEDVSPDISSARASNERRSERSRIDRGKEIGPELAQFEAAKGRASDALYNLGTDILAQLLKFEPVMTFGADSLTVVLELLRLGIAKMEQVEALMTPDNGIDDVEAAIHHAHVMKDLKRAMETLGQGEQAEQAGGIDADLRALINMRGGNDPLAPNQEP